ncbi:MAG: DNA polymerase III subunit beta [Holophagales bacterium]|jgi:DNA polymerase-3 subunit beta|nr:DNA polymerase III subunit beta [Holophagales bacterium]
MNFQVQVSRERLDKTLGVLKHALEKRVTLPILQHILMEISNQEMTLRTTDMELAFEAVLPIEGSGSKSVAIPGKKFVETVHIYPDGILTLEWPSDGNRVWIRAKGFNSEHNLQPPEGFPELPKPNASMPSVKLPMILFKKAIQLGSIAISRDATKPALSGVLLHLTGKYVRVVSTDGFRLAVVEFLCETDLSTEARLIVPKRAMDIIPNSFDDDDPLELSWDDRSVFLNQPNLKFSTRRVTANYPTYEKVLPSELPRKVIIDREDFIKTLKVVGLKKDDYNKNVRLFFEFPNLRVLFQHPDEGVNQGNLNFSGEEQPLELAFNIDYLTELLDKLPGSEVIYQFKDDVGQGIFMSPSLEDMTFKYILMPVKFSSQN